jgi:CO/xanthine dehydrogenase Mo-binding subunit
MADQMRVVGQAVERTDGRAKVTGSAQFAADIPFARVLTACVVRSPIAHGLIRTIDVSGARELPGVRAVVTGEDVPFRYNLPLRDQPFLALNRVRYVGEPVVAVAADTPALAQEAASRVHVEYEPLEVVLDPFQAMDAQAPRIHPEFETYWRDESLFAPVPETNILSHFKLRRGDVAAAFESADAIFEGTYTSQAFSHAALEPHAAIAQVDGDGQLTLWASAQSPWFVADDLAIALNWPSHRVRVVTPYIGGGFGAKHGLKVEPVVVALALHTRGRPVRFVASREDVFSCTAVSGAAIVKLKTGVTKDGELLAREATVVWDTGAYADVGPLLCRNGSYSATGPYRIPAQRIDGYCVYTNKVVSAAFRGYGVPEMAFGYESQMDEIAHGLGLDPVELRRRNLIEDGDETATGERLQAVGLKPALEACAKALEWDKPKKKGRGRAIVTTAKSSVAPSGSSAFIQMNDDGTFTVMSSTTEMGQGSRTVIAQIAAESIGAKLGDVRVLASDTAFTPPDRSTSSSRSTFNMGNALIRAGGDVREQILQKAGEQLEASPDDLEVRDSEVGVRGVPSRTVSFKELAATRPGMSYGPIVGRGSYVPTGSTAVNLDTGEGRKVTAFWLYSAQGVEVEVDEATGKVEIVRVVSVHDAGRALNPLACETQIEGGVAMACSIALFEEVVLAPDGSVVNAALGEYPMFTSCDVPPITPIVLEIPHPDGPFGAKGIGEGPTTGMAPALANAIADAVGVRVTELPITAEKVASGLHEGAVDGQHERVGETWSSRSVGVSGGPW